MPTFGDYESVGEPIAITEERGHLSTIWQARKGGAAGPLYVVKCYAPRRPEPVKGQPEGALEKDRSLEFLEGIKQQKKAINEGGRCLAPIHAFGLSDDGAWYVTDFYPRNNLRAMVARRGRVDSAGLRHVLHSVVTACLSLKRSRGYSHGNLKAANVYLVGVPRSLRKTPLHLTDPYPASPLQLSQLEAADRQTLGDLLGQVVEAQDLRAIGELILQLVEGRLVISSYDYNYPIARSSAWDHLGKEGEFWRDLCNKLLDPQLSIEATNLELLERQFRPSAVAGKLPLVIAGVGVICLIAGGIYLVVSGMHKRRTAKFDSAMRTATEALAAANGTSGKDAAENALLSAAKLAEARAGIKEALQSKSGDSQAKDLEAEIDKAAENDYTSALRWAQRSLGETDLEKSSKWVAVMEKLKPDGSSISELKQKIDQARSVAESAAQADRSYSAATNAAIAAIAARNYLEASNQAAIALNIRPADPVSTRLMQEARQHLETAAVSQQQEQSYKNAINAANIALRGQRYSEATNQAAIALKIKPGDAAATQLMREALEHLQSAAMAAQQEQDYRRATNAAGMALSGQNYREATNQAGIARRIKPGDAVANGIMSEAVRHLQSAAMAEQQELDYRRATNAAGLALNSQKYQEATNQAGIALRIKPGDPAATSIMNQALGRLQSVAMAAQQEQDYQKATNAAGVALQGQRYSEATNQAAAALKIKPNDPVATKIMNEAQSRLASAAMLERQEQDYRSATNAAGLALSGQKYQEATNQAGIALKLKPRDPAANDLMSKGLAGIKSEEEMLKGYQAATNAAAVALSRQLYREATNQAGIALAKRPRDGPASQLMSQAVAGLAAADTGLKKATADADMALQRADFTNALSALDSALGFAKALEDSAAQKAGQNRRELASSLQTAFEKPDYERAFGLITNASPELPGLALLVATRACDKAIDEGHSELAANWLGRARTFRAAESVLSALSEKIKDLSKHPAFPTLLSIANLDFVWVAGIGSKKLGAYVAVNELSWRQYNELLKQLGDPPKPAGSNPDLPYTSKRFDEAAGLIEELNKSIIATNLNFTKGHWRLATDAEYLKLAGIPGDSPADWVNDQGQWSLKSEAVDRFQKLGENLAGSYTSQNARPITAGPLNSPLRDVLGNVSEWTADRKAFGIPHNAEKTTKVRVSRPESDSLIKLVGAGVRLVCEEGE